MSHQVTCKGPVSRRGLIKSTMAASLGYVLGRHFIPTAWAKDEVKKPGAAVKPNDKPSAAPAGYTVAKGKANKVILMWMGGGPSHLDTFDPKPGTPQSGGVKGIEAADGFQISEKFPMLAKQGKYLQVLRGVQSREGDHGQASHLMHTGYREQSGVAFPGIGSIVCAEAKDGPQSELPSYVALNGGGWGPGLYGASYAPFSLGAGQQIPDLMAPMGAKTIDERRVLLTQLDLYYSRLNGSSLATEHQKTYERAIKLSRSPLAKLFEIKGEDQKKAEAYGPSGFGRACYVAKKLLTQGGVRFVEIDQGGWDTHAKADENTRNLCNQIDTPFAKLVEELAAEGQLDSTLIIWMGEFGRTPDLNAGAGRDHYPHCFSIAMAGGGIKGGTVVGKSNATGHEPDSKAIVVPDFFYSVCEACGIDPTKIRESADGRPIQVVDRGAKAVPGIFG